MEPPKSPARAAVPLHLLVPAATVGLAAFALLTFAAPKPVFGVRVFGGPTDAPGQQTVRLVCQRDETGVVDTVPLRGVRVQIGATEAMVDCSAGDAGSVEVPVQLRPGERPHVRVTQAGRTLAEGVAFVSGDEWRARSVRRSSRVERVTFRGLQARGFVPGGALVLGKENQLYFQVEAGPEGWRCGPSGAGTPTPTSLPRFDSSGEGAEVTPPDRCGPHGFVFGVRPTFVTASVGLRSHEAPTEVFWEAQIPVVTAPILEASTLDPAPTGASPGQQWLRTRARSATAVVGFHARLEDEHGRRAAGYFPAQSDGRGGAWADLALDLRAVLDDAAAPAPATARAAFLIVGTDEGGGTHASSTAVRLALPEKGKSVDQLGPTSVAAADPTADVVLGPLLPWVDGLAPAARREAARTKDARRRVMALVFAGALLEAVLVFRRARRSTAHFRAHLTAAEAGAADEASEEALDLHAVEDDSRLSGAFLAIAVIVFGFAILALVVASRLG
jgi:hypothetical protein